MLTKAIWDKKYLQKDHWVCLVLAIYSWAWGLPLSTVYTPSETPLKKTNFSLGNYQLEIAFWLRMDTCAHLPSQSWDPIWLGSMWALCMLLESLCSYVHQTHCIRKMYSIVLKNPTWWVFDPPSPLPMHWEYWSVSPCLIQFMLVIISKASTC